ncbi:MAG: NAD(P)-dependent alcohol dehydrogenase [Acidimicrobiia bacterium]
MARADGCLAVMPDGAAFEDATAVPSAALTALQGLRDKGGLQPGQTVLINGASGGVGTYAVQIAEALGAEVAAVCGPRGVDIARSLGADRVIDYTTTDFTRSDERFDVLLDVAGTRSFRATRRVLAPGGIHVVIGGPMGGLLGRLGRVIRVRLGGMVTRRRTVFFIAALVRGDMETLRDMLADGRIRSVIDSRYPFKDVVEPSATSAKTIPRARSW